MIPNKTKSAPKLGALLLLFCCLLSSSLVCTASHAADLASSGVLLQNALVLGLVDCRHSSENGLILVSSAGTSQGFGMK